MPLSPLKLIALGFVFAAIGAALPFMMVLKMVTVTFPLVFLTVGFSVAGTGLGIVGAVYYVRGHNY